MNNPVLTVIGVFLAVILGSPVPAFADQGGCTCKPDFREVSEDVMIVDMEVWSLHLKVALIGCKADLAQITDQQLEKLRQEFHAPKEWSNITLVAEAKDADLREKVTKRVNEILDAPIVSTVIFHHVRLFDHIE